MLKWRMCRRLFHFYESKIERLCVCVCGLCLIYDVIYSFRQFICVDIKLVQTYKTYVCQRKFDIDNMISMIYCFIFVYHYAIFFYHIWYGARIRACTLFVLIVFENLTHFKISGSSAEENIVCSLLLMVYFWRLTIFN